MCQQCPSHRPRQQSPQGCGGGPQTSVIGLRCEEASSQSQIVTLSAEMHVRAPIPALALALAMEPV